MPERADGSPRWIFRRTLKVAVAGALAAAGLPRLVGALRRRQAGGVRVLVVSYHRVTHDYAAASREGLASLLVSADTLRRQLAQLARTHEVVSLADARRLLAEGGRPRARDVVVITFDDGYADVHGVALPVVEALRIPATAFVVTGYVGGRQRLPHDRIYAALAELQRRGIGPAQAALPGAEQALLGTCDAGGPAATLDRLIARLPHPALLAVADALARRVGLDGDDLPASTRLLSWGQVRALHRAGVDVGGHTVHHAVLTHLAPADARAEVRGCREALAARLGRPPRHFAYPNGHHTPAVRRLVADCGFEGAVTTEDRENVRGGDPLALRRKMVWENTTLGPRGYSAALAACNLEGVFGALGLVRPTGPHQPDGTVAAAPGAGPTSGRERARGP